jgi:hypothetical protein
VFDVSGSLQSRTVRITFRGSPGGSATFRLGERGPFPMLERKAEDFPALRRLQVALTKVFMFFNQATVGATQPSMFRSRAPMAKP